MVSPLALKNTLKAESLALRANSILNRAQSSGCFVLDGHAPSDEERMVQSEAAELAETIASRLLDCPPEDILQLADTYDLVCRIAYRRMPDATFMSRLYRRAFRAWQSGDSDIADSDIFAMIAPRIGNPSFSVDPEQQEAYHTMLRRWLVTLDRYGTFPGVTTYENLARLTLLQTHRIKDYVADPAAARRRWYELNRIDDLTGLSPLLRRTYRRYLSSLTPDVLPQNSSLLTKTTPNSSLKPTPH